MELPLVQLQDGKQKYYGTIGANASNSRKRERLEKETDDLIETAMVDLEKCDPKFKEFCIRCYNKKNPDDAVQASIELARHVGVPEEKILHSMEELDKYFLD